MIAQAALPRIHLGDDYSIPRIINGLWQLSEGHTDTTLNHEDLYSTFDRLVDLGLDTFDCADIYTGVEDLLGGYLRRKRKSHGEAGLERVQIHTKYVPNLGSLGTLRPQDVERTIDRSLARLGVDRLNMVQFAWWDYAVPRYVDVAQWLDRLREKGKIQLLGETNFDHIRLNELHEAGVSIKLHQLQYSVLDQRPHGQLTEFAASHESWMACYGSLAGGFLSDRYLGTAEPTEPFENRSLRKYKLIVDEFGGWDRFQECLVVLSQIAEKHSVRVANVAAAFILARKRVAAIILGTRSDRHIAENLVTLEVRLDDADMVKIETLIGEAPGPRGPVFGLERDREGPHGRIMKYDLN